MAWWLWLVIGFCLIAFEMFLPAGFALLIVGLSFVITGITTAIGLDDPAWLEWLICFVSFVVLFFSVRRPLMGMFGLNAPSNYKEIEGQEIKIISSVAPGATGQGEMQGTQWKVRNVGPEAIHSGEILKVIRIDGLTVEVKK
jgi:membrane protein implicated in regulation of membrane protease activity